MFKETWRLSFIVLQKSRLLQADWMFSGVCPSIVAHTFLCSLAPVLPLLHTKICFRFLRRWFARYLWCYEWEKHWWLRLIQTVNLYRISWVLCNSASSIQWDWRTNSCSAQLYIYFQFDNNGIYISNIYFPQNINGWISSWIGL